MSFLRNPECWVALAASLPNKHSANSIYPLPLPACSGLQTTPYIQSFDSPCIQLWEGRNESQYTSPQMSYFANLSPFTTHS